MTDSTAPKNQRCPTFSHNGVSQCRLLHGHDGRCLFEMCGLKWTPDDARKKRKKRY